MQPTQIKYRTASVFSTKKHNGKIENPTVAFIKKGIWAYFILLLIEGAFRKWFLPGLSTPLLVVRDPLVILLFMRAKRAGLFPDNNYINTLIGVSILSFIFTMLLGHRNIFVAVYGIRILVLHFPFIFLIGKVFTREDVIKMGKVTLWITIPMAILIGIQYYSPQSAWVNRGVGGNEAGAGFSTAGAGADVYRPPGTFSFTLGTTLYFSFAASFVVYFWLAASNVKVNKLILIGATLGVIASIPLSISRSLFFQVILTGVFAAIGAIYNPKYLGKMIVASFSIFLAVIILQSTSFFQTSSTAFGNRFNSANHVEGGLEGVLIDRFLGGMYGAIFNAKSLPPLWGYGLGMGTNVGGMLLSGSAGFLISEGEWGRLIGEMGILLGLIIIIVRIAFVIELVKRAFRVLKRDNLPWILLSNAIIILLQGQWGQPTALGFATIAGGLVLASFNNKATGKVLQKANRTVITIRPQQIGMLNTNRT